MKRLTFTIMMVGLLVETAFAAYDVTIQDAAGNMDPGTSPFTSSATLNTISDNRIEQLLEGGGNVTIIHDDFLNGTAPVGRYPQFDAT